MAYYTIIKEKINGDKEYVRTNNSKKALGIYYSIASNICNEKYSVKNVTVSINGRIVLKNFAKNYFKDTKLIKMAKKKSQYTVNKIYSDIMSYKDKYDNRLSLLKDEIQKYIPWTNDFDVEYIYGTGLSLSITIPCTEDHCEDHVVSIATILELMKTKKEITPNDIYEHSF